MGPVDRILQNFSTTCVASSLKRDECEVGLAGIPEPRLLIDLDLPGSPLDEQSVRCDYLVFAGDGRLGFLVAPVEFKGTWRWKAVRQLQAGANESERHAPTVPAATFRPVVVLQRFGRKMVRRTLRARVVFRNRPEPIRVLKCGQALGKVLERTSATGAGPWKAELGAPAA